MKYYVLIKDFNIFMYDHSLHCGRKHFCSYCLHAFITEEILKRHIEDCYEINGHQRIKMPKKDEYITFKNYERKIKSRFIIYADFKSILVPENNGKQKPEESYTNKYQKYIASRYGYILVSVDDGFSKPFKTCLGKDSVYNSINSMIEESTYCSEIMKKHFNKLVLTKEHNEDSRNCDNCWICDNADVKVRDHCHITGKNRGSAHRDCNINLKLNHKIPITFHNLKIIILILLWKN